MSSTRAATTARRVTNRRQAEHTSTSRRLGVQPNNRRKLQPAPRRSDIAPLSARFAEEAARRVTNRRQAETTNYLTPAGRKPGDRRKLQPAPLRSDIAPLSARFAEEAARGSVFAKAPP